MEKMKNYIPKGESRAYFISALGQGMVYGIMSSYISDFYMNVMQLAPIFVLLLMLFARIWDAINDPMMGMIVDKYNPKRGKMRTYLLYSPIPIAILTLLLFFSPNLSSTGLMIYATITYVLWGMVYTVGDVPFWGLPNIMTPNPDERGKLISVSRTTNGIGSAIPMALYMLLGILLPNMGLTALNLEKTRFMSMAIIAAVIGCPMFFSSYFKIKERVPTSPPVKEPGKPGALKTVFTCKPLMLTVAMGILASGRYLFQAGAVHVARYSFYVGKNLDALATNADKEAAIQGSISTVSLVFSLATAAGMFGTMLFIPKLIEKFNYKQLVIGSCLIGGVSSIIMYTIGYEHFWACIPFLVISSIPLGVINVISYAMVGDALDYMEWKTGVKQAGLGQACQSFVLKLGNALATSGIVLSYQIFGMDIGAMQASNDAISIAATSIEPAMRTGMFSLVSIIPAISLLLCIIPVFFYDIVGDKKDKITKELAERRQKSGAITE